MGIKFVTKSEQQVQSAEKQRLTLLDAIRIMAWEQHKLDNPDYERGLEGYAKEFGDEWKVNPIHDKSLEELLEFIRNDLGFTTDELLEIRTEHYSEKKLIQQRVDAKKQRELGYGSLSSMNNFAEGNEDDMPPY
jgi:hypothetical protein